MTLASAELTRLRSDYEATLLDRCKVGTVSTTQDELGQPVESWSYGSEIACGLQMVGGRGSELRTADGTVVVADAVLRLPFGTAVAAAGSIQVTKRCGVTLAVALTYGVLGRALDGVAGVLCYLQAVEP